MAGPEVFFFEIPIYRCSQEDHNVEWERDIQKFMVPSEQLLELDPEAYQRQLERARDATWRPWKFNGIVGWLRLYRLGAQLRGEVWFSTAKRIVRGSRATIKFAGKGFELEFNTSQSNVDIGNTIIASVETFAASPHYQTHYIDLECFEALSKRIDWRRLLNFDST